MSIPSPAEDIKTSPPLTHEADIGSGEKTPAQHETEEMIRQIPPLPSDKDRQGGNEDGADQPPITSPS